MYQDTLHALQRNDSTEPWKKAPVKFFRYPGGDATIRITGELKDIQLLTVAGGTFPLDFIALWYKKVSSLTRHVYLFLPYLPGARGDHDEQYTPNDANIHAGILASIGIEHLITVDPHSMYWLEAYKEEIEFKAQRYLAQYEVIDISDFIKDALPEEKYFFNGIIAPDKGATHRAESVADILGKPIFYATKHRNPGDGKLSHFACEHLPHGHYLIVDDICDGGGTFNGLAEVIKKQNPDVTLSLWVTHGIFSGDPVRVAYNLRHYQDVHTTNSHQGVVDYMTKNPDNNITTYQINLNDICLD